MAEPSPELETGPESGEKFETTGETQICQTANLVEKETHSPMKDLPTAVLLRMDTKGIAIATERHRTLRDGKTWPWKPHPNTPRMA